MVRMPYITVGVIVCQVLGLVEVVCRNIAPNMSPHILPLRVTRKRWGSVVLKVIMKGWPGLESGILPIANESACILVYFRPRGANSVSMKREINWNDSVA